MTVRSQEHEARGLPAKQRSLGGSYTWPVEQRAGLRVFQLHSDQPGALVALLGLWTADKFLTEAARLIFPILSINTHACTCITTFRRSTTWKTSRRWPKLWFWNWLRVGYVNFGQGIGVSLAKQRLEENPASVCACIASKWKNTARNALRIGLRYVCKQENNNNSNKWKKSLCDVRYVDENHFSAYTLRGTSSVYHLTLSVILLNYES